MIHISASDDLGVDLDQDKITIVLVNLHGVIIVRICCSYNVYFRILRENGQLNLMGKRSMYRTRKQMTGTR